MAGDVTIATRSARPLLLTREDHPEFPRQGQVCVTRLSTLSAPGIALSVMLTVAQQIRDTISLEKKPLKCPVLNQTHFFSTSIMVQPQNSTSEQTHKQYATKSSENSNSLYSTAA